MPKSELLGLRTEPCLRNMVGQRSHSRDSLIVSRVVRRRSVSSCFWSSDCGSVLAIRYQGPPGEARGKVRRSALVVNSRNVCRPRPPPILGF